MPKRDTQEQFLEKAGKTHGDKYDYSQVAYVSARKMITIVCPEHGPFEQKPVSHIEGKGCLQCGYVNMAAKALELGQRTFLERAKKAHGDKYDYSQVLYRLIDDKVIIICPEHGPFKQKPVSHFAGIGCWKCTGRAPLSHAEFLERAGQCHGDKYDYSLTEYKGANHKLQIICPEHGPFEQLAYSHMRGAGCMKCSEEKRSGLWSASKWASIQEGRTPLLYIVELSGTGEFFYKVGITLQGMKHRFPVCRVPYRVKQVALFSSFEALDVHQTEAKVKKLFRELRYKPTKQFNGQTECYSEVRPILDFLATQSEIQQVA